MSSDNISTATTTEEPVLSKNGIVAFFDILGYQSFLERNEPDVAAKIILNCLATLKSDVSTKLFSIYNFPKNQHVQDYIERLEFLVFSDSILLTFPDDAVRTTDQMKSVNWVITLLASGILYKHLFVQGLPVRGCISYGSFFRKDSCFAGKSIVKAYQICEALDFAGVVLDNGALDEIAKIGKPDGDKVRVFYHDYAVPFKKDIVTIHPVIITPGFLDPFVTSDIRRLVVDCFAMHSKDITPAVMPKINNTEMYLRRLQSLQPGSFADPPPL